MKYIDIDCYERGCACASSNRFAGEQCEVVEIIRYKELTDEEINDIYDEWQALSGDPVKLYELFKLKAQE